MSSLPAHPQTAGGTPASLVAIAESDVRELAVFIAGQSGREPAQVESHLRWFLLDNPARDSEIPLGCGLRSTAGELVGCILYVPQMFRYQRQTLKIIGSSSFYVDERYRGNGGLIFLRFSELCRIWPLFGNSANADAARLWKARGAQAIADTDHELIGALRWPGLVEEAVVRRKLPSPLARVAAPPAAFFLRSLKRLRLDADAGASLVPLSSPEQAVELPLSADASVLTASRDLDFLRWRYFSGRDSTAAVFAFRSAKSAADLLVTVNQRPRGYRGQIRTLNLLDVYPAAVPEVAVSIVAALADRYRDAVDAIVLRGLNPALQNAFTRRGFVRRLFDSPNGWMLDKMRKLPTRDWYMVPADGDWLI